MNDALADKLKHLPTSPGVYQHKDAEGTVLYVGKAKNLRNRVRSLLPGVAPARTGGCASSSPKIEDVEIIVTDTEAEALILENNLIKQPQAALQHPPQGRQDLPLHLHQERALPARLPHAPRPQRRLASTSGRTPT